MKSEKTPAEFMPDNPATAAGVVHSFVNSPALISLIVSSDLLISDTYEKNGGWDNDSQ
jgi:hypothetical protein